jgi:Na+/proline symporter
MGALLGVFLLGVLTKRPREMAAISGVVAGLAVVLWVHFYTPIAWTWYVLIGTVVTFGVGLAASLFQGPPEVVMTREPVGALPHLPSQSTTAEE